MAADLRQLFSTSTRSVWRLETLDRYTVPEEDRAFREFLAGGPVKPCTPDNDPWIARLTGAGDTAYGRVHVVSRPLTPYVRFELALYRDSVAYGEDVRIADRSEHADRLADLDEDFWIFDDQTVAVMRYDDEGRFLGADVADDPAPYWRVRDRALAVAVPLAKFTE